MEQTGSLPTPGVGLQLPTVSEAVHIRRPYELPTVVSIQRMELRCHTYGTSET